MTKKCFVAFGKGVGFNSDNGYWYENIYCADSVTFEYQSTNPYTGGDPWMNVVVDGVSQSGVGYYPGTEQVLLINDYPLAGQYCPNPRGGRSGDCNSCLFPQQQYDCINGTCIPSTNYNTPGLYSSLSECETACGTGCSGKCLSNAEWAQIQGLAAQLKNKNCG